MTKGPSSQFERILIGQGWDNLSIKKNNAYNEVNYIKEAKTRESVMIKKKKTALVTLEIARTPKNFLKTGK